MRNRISLCLIVLQLGLSLMAMAQPKVQYSTSDKKAIKSYEAGQALYDGFQLNDAIQMLNEAASKDPQFIEPHILLAQVYADLGQIPNAITELEVAVKIDPKFFPNNHYFLAELHMFEGNYTEAQQSFLNYQSFGLKNPELETRTNLGLASCEFAIEALKHPVDFDPINLGKGVNSPAAEYYPCITGDSQTLLFTRLVKDSNSFDGKQEDFYTSSYVDKAWNSAVPVSEINTHQNEGAPTLSPDGQVLIFTACELNGDWGPGRQGLGSCDLFFSQKSGNRWSSPMNLGEKVNSYYWDSQPSFASDGRTLYFVRGRRGRNGYEDQDIWVSKLDTQGSWGKPEKLKGFVNTAQNEESVLIHPDGRTLYFSSNGHPGMGGLDIFVSRLQADGSWGKPENLGYPINTNSDENSLLVAADGKLAFFASDREGGYGDLDLYSFVLPEAARPIPVTYAKGEVFDKLSFKQLEARFELIDLETGELVVESYSDATTGEFLVTLPVNRDYALNVSRPNYLFYSENFSLKGVKEGEPFFLKVPLQKIQAGSSVVLNNVFFDTDKFELKPQSRIELMKLVEFMEVNPRIRIELGGHTDNVGSDDANLALSQKRAASVVEFLVQNGVAADRLSSKGYGESKPLADNSTEAGRAQNRRTEFKVLD